MDKRYSDRKIVHIKAALKSEGMSYPGFIENISEQGIYFLTAAVNSFRTLNRFSQGSLIDIELNMPSGEILNVHCRVIWFYKTPPYELTNSIGLEIVSPTSTYINYYKALQ